MSNPKLELLTPQNCMLILDRSPAADDLWRDQYRCQLLKNNVVALAKSAKAFNVPTLLTSVGSESFSYKYSRWEIG